MQKSFSHLVIPSLKYKTKIVKVELSWKNSQNSNFKFRDFLRFLLYLICKLHRWDKQSTSTWYHSRCTWPFESCCRSYSVGIPAFRGHFVCVHTPTWKSGKDKPRRHDTQSSSVPMLAPWTIAPRLTSRRIDAAIKNRQIKKIRKTKLSNWGKKSSNWSN